jgi:TatD DNase family protein
MFDTHAHVHDAAFDTDRDAMLARARAAGVTRILSVGTDLETSKAAADVAARYGLDYSIGIHPHDAAGAPDDLAAAFDALAAGAAHAPRAIGEMGLDYYYDHSPRDRQRAVLAAQLRYAAERGLPAIFHQRDAFDDFDAVLAEHGRGIRGVVHCFTGNTEQAKRMTGEYGLFLGIGGVATFKTAQQVRDAVLAVGLEHIILETDCPYLAPVPHRGSRNEPAFIEATAALLAKLFGIAPAEIVSRTTENAVSLFGA